MSTSNTPALTGRVLNIPLTPVASPPRRALLSPHSVTASNHSQLGVHGVNLPRSSRSSPTPMNHSQLGVHGSATLTRHLSTSSSISGPQGSSPRAVSRDFSSRPASVTSNTNRTLSAMDMNIDQPASPQPRGLQAEQMREGNDIVRLLQERTQNTPCTSSQIQNGGSTQGFNNGMELQGSASNLRSQLLAAAYPNGPPSFSPPMTSRTQPQISQVARQTQMPSRTPPTTRMQRSRAGSAHVALPPDHAVSYAGLQSLSVPDAMQLVREQEQARRRAVEQRQRQNQKFLQTTEHAQSQVAESGEASAAGVDSPMQEIPKTPVQEHEHGPNKRQKRGINTDGHAEKEKLSSSGPPQAKMTNVAELTPSERAALGGSLPLTNAHSGDGVFNLTLPSETRRSLHLESATNTPRSPITRHDGLINPFASGDARTALQRTRSGLSPSWNRAQRQEQTRRPSPPDCNMPPWNCSRIPHSNARTGTGFPQLICSFAATGSDRDDLLLPQMPLDEEEYGIMQNMVRIRTQVGKEREMME